MKKRLIKNEKKWAKTINEASNGKISVKTAAICAKEINKSVESKDLEFDPDTCIRFYENWSKLLNLSKDDRFMMDCLLSELRSLKIEQALRRRTEKECGSIGFKTFYKDRQTKSE
jgi:hypothetical protein